MLFVILPSEEIQKSEEGKKEGKLERGKKEREKKKSLLRIAFE